MGKIRILHIAKDDKFFDEVFHSFELQDRLENKAVLEVKNVENYKFTYIKKLDRVQVVKTLKEILKTGCYDVLFFHSLPVDKYKYFKFIPKEKIVIWWAWGYDIYHSVNGMKPIIPIQLHKPKTRSFLMQEDRKIITIIKRLIKLSIISRYYEKQRRNVIKRVDYFQPVLPLEYKLMCNIKNFRAKEFYYPSCFSYKEVEVQDKLVNGNIFIGHSLSPNNNNLDVWYDIKQYIPKNRKVVIPISYGNNKRLASELLNQIQSKELNILFLREFLPINEYNELLNEASYAVYGVMRQEAMGNIYHCLRNRIKVFLYKGSLVYKFLVENGYVVFSIEDMDENSFNIPLSINEHEQNIKAYKKQSEYIRNVSQNAFEEIIFRVENLNI